MPFSATKGDERELRDICQIYFYGGNPECDSEIRTAWIKWRTIINAFLSCVDARYGNFIFLPFEGGIFEQPVKTMSVFELLRGLYREKIDKDLKSSVRR